MRSLWLLSIISVSLYAAIAVQVGDKFKDSGKCKACHSHIVKQWEESWHAKSHYDNDEYFQKTIDYVARKNNRKSLNTIKIECAACHNPRISVTSTTAEYEAIASLKLDKDSAATKALKSDQISEGINCVVCHNIDQIHDELPDSKRGIHRVSWMKSGIMSGPYADAKSPYHKVEQRPFMDTNPNQLCFVCHANDTSEEGHRFTSMQTEFNSATKQCVDCHMGPRKVGVAATLRDANGKVHNRLIRDHSFKGAHTESMWQGALNVEAKKIANAIAVTISNPQPHSLPSGFGSREIVIDAHYMSGKKIIKTETFSLTSHYVNKRGKATVPHLAAKTISSVSIPALGSKTFTLPTAVGADSVSVIVSYRLVNDEVREMLELKDPIWSKKMVIKKLNLAL
ncbi:MAG: multiheme c-type cytochrome [Sulfuricurvum sp.]|uniref:multiheme c-type cytochrome n=1 Tax=Sulfuricurvum sp. TaxID=2025608 RepID=UPI0027331F4C|nr:multiheme c-type cytochrome [Sulfuricurvum sp.]MDP2850951.1 multiheme c-type cytochrome [Sulfuricurvum sp.]